MILNWNQKKDFGDYSKKLKNHEASMQKYLDEVTITKQGIFDVEKMMQDREEKFLIFIE